MLAAPLGSFMPPMPLPASLLMPTHVTDATTRRSAHPGTPCLTSGLRKVKHAGRKVAFNHGNVGICQKFEGNRV
jgi:hypothetical protein